MLCEAAGLPDEPGRAAEAVQDVRHALSPARIDHAIVAHRRVGFALRADRDGRADATQEIVLLIQGAVPAQEPAPTEEARTDEGRHPGEERTA